MNTTHANLAKLAREIAMDVEDVDTILSVNQIDDDTWSRIQANPQFQSMLSNMVIEWNSASNARARIRVKAQTAIEALIDLLVREVASGEAPLTQKVDAIRQLARLGELEGKEFGGGQAGDRVSIVINMGPSETIKPLVIDAVPNRETVDG